jgi:hypothetical protein
MIVAGLFCMAPFWKELGIDCGMELGAAAARAESPAALAELPVVPLSEPGGEPLLRRTPDVMREDAARVKRGDLFSTWSNEFLE